MPPSSYYVLIYVYIAVNTIINLIMNAIKDIYSIPRDLPHVRHRVLRYVTLPSYILVSVQLAFQTGSRAIKHRASTGPV